MADFVSHAENKHRVVVMVGWWWWEGQTERNWKPWNIIVILNTPPGRVDVVVVDRKKLETLEYNCYSKHTPKTCNLGQ